MRVIVVCERSGRVRERFRALGHDAWSCDLEPAEDGSPHHLQADAIQVAFFTGPWDLMIAHPDCQYLTSSGLHWNRRVPGRAAKTEEAVAFGVKLCDAPIPRKCVENPPGRLTAVMRERGALIQIIQPFHFGADASKKTALILYNLPPLRKTKYVEPRMVEWPPGSGRMRPRWANQTDSGQNRLGPSPTRSIDRARTYPGVADAMAIQWGARMSDHDLYVQEAAYDARARRPDEVVTPQKIAEWRFNVLRHGPADSGMDRMEMVAVLDAALMEITSARAP